MKFEQVTQAIADLLCADGYFPDPKIINGCARVCIAAAARFQETARVRGGQKAFLFVVTAHALRALYHGNENTAHPPFLTQRMLDHVKRALIEVYNIQLVPLDAEEKVVFLNLTAVNEGFHVGRGDLFKFSSVPEAPEAVVREVTK